MDFRVRQKKITNMDGVICFVPYDGAAHSILSIVCIVETIYNFMKKGVDFCRSGW